MARAIRIPIDDDEVFERMKARKQALDLTWEEVLHRGLRDVPDENAGESRAPGAGPGGQASREFGPDAGHHGRNGRNLGGMEIELGSGDSVGEMVDEIKGQVQDQVRESLRASMKSVEVAGSDLEREMTELESAEDAVLGFAGLAGEDSRYQVPLRVRLETSRRGMDVDVVAVREGKSVAEMNRFDSETRRAINEHLASGGTATLSFDGAESYDVAPVLTWSHGDDGNPTVTDIAIEAVLFDD